MPLTLDKNARRFFDLSPDLLCVLSEAGEVRMANPAWGRVLGWPPAEVEGRPLVDFVHPGDQAALREAIARVFEGKPPARLESRLRTREGELRVVEWYGEAAEGQIYAIAHDITEIRAREEELREKTRHLSQANADLNRFASVVVHDLQAPVRKLMMFGERLESLAGDSLPGPLADMIRRMRASAERISLLVADLHAWSRAGTAPLELASLDLNRTVQEVQADLEEALEKGGGRLIAGALPTLEASPTLMRILLQNLIANAIKFQRAGSTPIVQIEAAVRGGEVELRVADNGIGIEPQYHARIFGIFQRLHSYEKYPGSGVGLATCARVVERHHGQIRVESAPGEGSTFIVTLPLTQPVAS